MTEQEITEEAMLLAQLNAEPYGEGSPCDQTDDALAVNDKGYGP
jgi:hypothetical protein